MAKKNDFQPPPYYSGIGDRASDYSFLSTPGGSTPGGFLTGGMANQFRQSGDLFRNSGLQQNMPKGMKFPDGTRGGGKVSSIKGKKKHGFFRRYVIPVAAGIVGGAAGSLIGQPGLGYMAGSYLGNRAAGN